MDKITYVLQVKHVGTNSQPLFLGSWDDCLVLFEGLKKFPKDITTIEIWEEDTCVTTYKWKSPYWEGYDE